MHRIAHSSSLLVAAAFTFACGGEPAPAPAKVATQRAERSASPASEAAAPAPIPGGAPKITVDEPVHDFGGIKATDTVEHVYKIRNTGDADLKIERVEKT